MKGKFIVFYGTNNLGKTTQAKRLVDYIKAKGMESKYEKYPIYDLSTGKKINEILRGGKKQEISEFRFQMLYTQNREEYQPVLEGMLKNGINVVAEDYRGTGLAWGKAKGLSKSEYDLLHCLNSRLLPEDIAFLFDGKPFKESKEKDHIHETNDELMKRCRKTHLELGKIEGWIKIDANQSRAKVFGDVINEIRKKFGENYL